MGSTFYTELRTSAYVVQVQRDAFYGLAKGVTAPNLALTCYQMLMLYRVRETRPVYCRVLYELGEERAVHDVCCG